MVPSEDIFPALEIGLRVVVQADTQKGYLSVRGEITYVGSHHFRVSCDTRFPSESLSSKKEVKLFLEGKDDLLPMKTRFIRHMDNRAEIIILALPEINWRSNRRAFFRGQVDAIVTLTRSDGSRLIGKAVNISGGGILAEFNSQGNVSVEKVKAEDIEIKIDFPQSDTITAKVRVVRVEKKGDSLFQGIRFTRISQRDQDRICRMVIVQEFEARRAEIKELVERVPLK